MKRTIHILALISILFAGCSKELSVQTQEDLQTLKDTDIASIQQQVQNIRSSIGTIETLSTEIEKYIETLQDVSGDLEENYENLSKTLETVKSSLQGKIDGSKEQMLTDFESARTLLESQLSDIDSTVKALQNKRTSLDNWLDSFRKYSDDTYATKDWIKATFATLESQNAIVSDVAGMKAALEVLTASLKETEKEVMDLLDQQLLIAENDLKIDLYNANVQTVNSAKTAVANARAELESAFEKDMAKAFEDSETKLKTWVSEKLLDYFTVAEYEAKVQAFNTLVGKVPEGKNVQSEIDDLIAGLNKAKEDVRKAYEQAIKNAIEKSGKEIDSYILDNINSVKDDISKLSVRVYALEDEVIKLKARISELDKKINDIDKQAESISLSLSILTETGKTLQQYVEDVKAMLLNEDTRYFNEVSDLVEALQTIADKLQEQIDDLEAYVGTLPAGTTQTNVVEWVKASEQTVRKQFEGYAIMADIDTFKNKIDKIITDHGGKISTYSTTLSELIDKNKDTIDGWINEKLTGYHNTAVFQAKLDSLEIELKKGIDAKDSDIAKDLTKLENDYQKALDDFRTAYANAIKSAVENNQGRVTTAIDNAVSAANTTLGSLNTRYASMESRITVINADFEKLAVAVDTISRNLEKLEDFIEIEGFESLQEIVDSVKTTVKECKLKYVSQEQFDDLKLTVFGDDKTLGLDHWVDELVNIESSLKQVKADSDSLAKYFALADIADNSELYEGKTTLRGILDLVNEKLAEMRHEVNGSGENKGLQAMIDDIKKKLFGEAMDPENPAEGSMAARIQILYNAAIATTFSSISYLPTNYHHSVEPAGSVTLQFVVHPVRLVSFLNGQNCKLYFYNPDNGVKTPLTTTVSDQDASSGVFTVTGEGRSIEAGGFIVLYVDAGKDENHEALTFTSQYVPVLSNE